jgi:hypothetical protein
MAAATDCGFGIPLHLQYSPDMTLSDLRLFLKTKLRDGRFGSNDYVMEAVNKFFEDQKRVLF